MRIYVLLVVVAACKPAPTADDYFGATVVPPRGLDKIRPGMTEKEALAAQPAARIVRPSVIAIASGVKDVELLAMTDAKADSIITRVFARVTQPFSLRVRGQLANRWGKTVEKDTWSSDTWRASVRDDGSATEIDYWPAMTAAFWGPPGALPVALAKVEPGMMKHQIEQVIPPDVARLGRFAEDNATVTFLGEDKPGGLREVTMDFDRDHARDVLLKAWGPGELAPEEGTLRNDFEDRHVWFGSTGWRATLFPSKPDRITPLGPATDDMLTFTHYVPAAKLLGEGPELAALAASPFGKTLEELAAGYPGMESNVFALPPTELSEHAQVMFILDAKAKVDTAKLMFNYTAKGKGALKAMFDQKWGAPKPDKTGLLVYHAGAPYISAHDDGQSWELVVRPVAPVAAATVR